MILKLLLPIATLGFALTAAAQEECLNVTFDLPVCTANFGFLGWANVTACEDTLTNLSLTIRAQSDPGILLGSSSISYPNGATNTLRTAGQVFPLTDGYADHPEYYQAMVWTAVAKDNQGRVATQQIIVPYDFTPPALTCPDITVTAANGSNAVVNFAVTASSDAIVSFSVPSGSLFPLGTNVVDCTARDLCHNTNIVAFQVIVLPPLEDCLLHVEIAQAAPLSLKFTWDCGGALESAPGVDGPWSDVVGAASPHLASVLPGNRFFRVRRSFP